MFCIVSVFNFYYFTILYHLHLFLCFGMMVQWLGHWTCCIWFVVLYLHWFRLCLIVSVLRVICCDVWHAGLVQYVRRAMSNSEKLELIVVSKGLFLGCQHLLCFFLSIKARFPLPELTARVDGWSVSITHQHGPCWRVRVSTSRVDGPSIRPVNSASGNRD